MMTPGRFSSEVERLTAALVPNYSLDREIGRGTLGIVYAARTADGQPAAVKVLSRDLVGMMREPNEFIEAIERARRVRHPALLPILGAFLSADGDLCYAMALAPGLTARERTERDGALSSADVATIGEGLCEALAAAHTAGLLHGGVRPSNLHLDGPSAQLADLGVHSGLLAAGLKPEQITRIVGVPQYMSPEQIAATELDGRADIYSLGATLYEMMTGRPPFGGRTTTTVMASVLADDPDAPAGSDEGSQHVVDAILRAIEKVPDDRWPSAGAFAHALASAETPRETAPTSRPSAKGAGCMTVMVAGAIVYELVRAMA
jgi:eukaryotic-like serine/threonine-protein kinase